MRTAELFPGWMAHEVVFFDSHFTAINTVARFMADESGWDVVVMWEKLLRRCAKAYCSCGELWERDMEECGCWNCGAKTPNDKAQGEAQGSSRLSPGATGSAAAVQDKGD